MKMYTVNNSEKKKKERSAKMKQPRNSSNEKGEREEGAPRNYRSNKTPQRKTPINNASQGGKKNIRRHRTLHTKPPPGGTKQIPRTGQLNAKNTGKKMPMA